MDIQVSRDRADEVRHAFRAWKATLTPIEWQDAGLPGERDIEARAGDVEPYANLEPVRFRSLDQRFLDFLASEGIPYDPA